MRQAIHAAAIALILAAPAVGAEDLIFAHNFTPEDICGWSALSTSCRSAQELAASLPLGTLPFCIPASTEVCYVETCNGAPGCPAIAHIGEATYSQMLLGYAEWQVEVTIAELDAPVHMFGLECLMHVPAQTATEWLRQQGLWCAANSPPLLTASFTDATLTGYDTTGISFTGSPLCASMPVPAALWIDTLNSALSEALATRIRAATSGEFACVPGGAGDTTPPTNPGPVASPTHDGGPAPPPILLSWGASSDSGGSGLRRYRIGLGTTYEGGAVPCQDLLEWDLSTQASTPSDLPPGDYFFAVCAEDNAGNMSEVVFGGPYTVN